MKKQFTLRFLVMTKEYSGRGIGIQKLFSEQFYLNITLKGCHEARKFDRLPKLD